MLHKNVIKICQEEGANLAERGVILSVGTGSAFYSMINSSVQPLAALESMDSASLESMEVDPVAEVVGAAESPEHDNAQLAVIAQLAAAARYTENHAQNVLIPKVEEALESVKAYVEAYNDNAVRGFEIVQAQYPALIDSQTLQKTVSRWQGTPLDAAPVPAFKCENISLEELIRTGSSLFDAEVAEFVAQQDPEFLQASWNEFRSSGYSHVLSVTQQENLPKILIFFLFSLSLYQGLPDGCYVENEAQFRADISRAMSVLGNAVNRIIARRDNEVKFGQLVLNRGDARNSRVIIVSGPAYAKAKVDGLTDEMLKAAVQYEASLNLADILASADRLTRLWKSYEATCRVTETENRYSLTLRAMNVFLRDAINNAAEGELPMDQETHRSQIASVFNAIPLNLRNNHYKLIRWLVWSVLYPQSDSLAHLERLDAIADENPDLDIREAASIALIQYVADWAANQITVVKQ